MTPYKDAEKQRASSRKSYHKHRREISERRKERYQNNKATREITTLCTTIKGRSVTIHGLHKRPKPQFCELCGKPSKTLLWHHWDDSNLNLGMWIHRGGCHSFAEHVENGWIEKYRALKEKLSNAHWEV